MYSREYRPTVAELLEKRAAERSWDPSLERLKPCPQREEIYVSLTKHGLDPREAARSSFGSGTPTSEDLALLHGNLINPPFRLEVYRTENTYTTRIINQITGGVYQTEGRTEWDKDFLENQVEQLTRELAAFNQSGMQNNDGRRFWEKYVVAHALYESYFGILPVMAERPWIRKSSMRNNPSDPAFAAYRDLTLEYETKRMQHSLLIVTHVPYQDDAAMTEFTNLVPGGWLEYRTNQVILPSDFLYILIPKHLQPEAQETLSSFGERIKYIPNNTYRVSGGKWWRKWMVVPDYQKALEEIMLNNPQEQYWISGVRLPTEEDVGMYKKYYSQFQ